MASVGRRLQSALAAFLLAAVLGAHAVAAQATVNYSKFLLFFQLLDQSGAIAKEFAAADGTHGLVRTRRNANGDVNVSHQPPAFDHTTRRCMILSAMLVALLMRHQCTMAVQHLRKFERTAILPPRPPCCESQRNAAAWIYCFELA
jgi:uncharacterized protein YcfJ